MVDWGDVKSKCAICSVDIYVHMSTTHRFKYVDSLCVLRYKQARLLEKLKTDEENSSLSPET